MYLTESRVHKNTPSYKIAQLLSNPYQLLRKLNVLRTKQTVDSFFELSILISIVAGLENLWFKSNVTSAQMMPIMQKIEADAIVPH